MIKLRIATSPDWTSLVLENFDTFLNDHAAAEKKASGMAMSMVSHYPDRLSLVKAMIDLSIEEMTHFRDVVKVMTERGICLSADEKDPYINEFRKTMRTGSDEFLLDRLLTAGIIEARGCERFGLVADALSEPALKRFYTAISRSESRHSSLFTDLALEYFSHKEVTERLEELLDAEADIVAVLPLRAALH